MTRLELDLKDNSKADSGSEENLKGSAHYWSPEAAEALDRSSSCENQPNMKYSTILGNRPTSKNQKKWNQANQQCDQMIWRKNRPIFSKNRPKWSPTYYLLNKRAFLPHFWALGILYWLTLLPKVAQVLGKWPNFACQINYLAQNFPYFCSIFSKKFLKNWIFSIFLCWPKC